jgi:iron complex transport system permease protein
MEKTRTERPYFIITLCALVLGVVFVVSLCLGRAFTVKDLFNYFFSDNPSDKPYIGITLFKIRIPRILAAICIGMSLSTAGASFQGLFQNPMVSPDILGASAGASVGAAIAILLDLNLIGVQVLSFLCAVAAVLLTYLVSIVVGGKQKTMLVLVLSGMVTGSLFNAFISITKYLADSDEKLPAITFWLMGSLASVTPKDCLLLYCLFIPSALILYLLRWKLNVMACGEEEAEALGINTRRLQMIVIICSTLLSASSVSIAGMIGWVGLAVPHIARMITGPNYRWLLPTSALIGGVFLLIVDDLSRSLINAEIPLGILTSLCGAPFFLYLLLKGKRTWA